MKSRLVSIRILDPGDERHVTIDVRVRHSGRKRQTRLECYRGDDNHGFTIRGESTMPPHVVDLFHKLLEEAL